MMTEKAPAAMPSPGIQSNQYSATYVLSLVFGIERSKIKLDLRPELSGMKVYEMNGNRYHYAAVRQQPPKNPLYRWEAVAKKYNRIIYRGISRGTPVKQAAHMALLAAIFFLTGCGLPPIVGSSPYPIHTRDIDGTHREVFIIEPAIDIHDPRPMHFLTQFAFYDCGGAQSGGYLEDGSRLDKTPGGLDRISFQYHCNVIAIQKRYGELGKPGEDKTGFVPDGYMQVVP